MRKQGFTLIELMIVIAIIAIIAAIAIPNLLSGRMSANESSAGAALKLMTAAEATWLQQDPDGNGLKDYWTGDVSCLHRMYRADNTTKTAFIAIDLARADAAPLNPLGITTLPFGAPTIEVWTNVVAAVKSGYWFQVMANHDLLVTIPPGTTYAVNNVGTVPSAACHNSRFGFMAAPDAYGTSGVNSFIVNQEGTIYANDTGATVDANKWLTAAGETRNWPTVNPAGQAGVGGRNWRVAD
jgi:prepilin-type N-terminal cleavage/methylation domain-containing protein